MDQIDAVRAFLEVAEHRSFTAAADRLGLSKAMVSKHVGLLEARVGARLLNRSTRHVALTEAGARFAARARDAVAAWETMIEAAAEDADQPHGVLRVAGPKVFGESVLTRAASSFLTAQPNLRLELALEERRVDVIAEGFDLAVRVGAPEDSTLIGVTLGPYPYVFCAAPDYLRAHGRPEHPHALRAHRCIVNSALTNDGQWRFRRGDVELRVTPSACVRVNSNAPVVRFALDGHGIGLCMGQSVAADLAAGRLQAVLPDWNAYDRHVYALIPHRPLMPAKTRLFVDHLRSVLAATS